MGVGRFVVVKLNANPTQSLTNPTHCGSLFNSGSGLKSCHAFISLNSDLRHMVVFRVLAVSHIWKRNHNFGLLKKTKSSQAAVSTDTVLSAFPAPIAPPECASHTHLGVFVPTNSHRAKLNVSTHDQTTCKFPKTVIM